MKDRFQTKLFIKFASYTLGLAVVFAAVAVAFSSPYARQSKEDAAKIADSLAVSDKTLPTVIIDAGHGGEDGGATATDGTAEKDINLKIAGYLFDICNSFGIECKMTRDKDEMLDFKADATRKMRDLRARVQFTLDTPDCIFVSVHQNKFPQSSCKGTQVYYSKNNENSEALARFVQNAAKKYLQPDNERQIKRAGSEIFVLDRCKCPAILTECGFLSNPDDLAKLKDEEYLKKLALTVFSAITEYFESDI